MARTLSAVYDVCEIGMFGWNEIGMVPFAQQLDRNRWRVQVDRSFHGDDFGGLLKPFPLDIPEEIAGLLYLRTVQEQFEEGARACGTGGSGFPSLAKYIYNTNQALVQAASLTGRADLIVGCDFEALPAAVVLGRLFKASIVYDAHEYWPFSMNGIPESETEIWRGLDRFYAQKTDYRITVSDHLATVMTEDYSVSFDAIPNAVPFADAASPKARAAADDDLSGEVIFLFQGNFAEGRGLGLLIEAWPRTNERCVLQLRGPDNTYKNSLIEQARATGLLDRRIFFPDALPESDLIEGASQADVGLIPYEPISLNNKFCCPNKLSQYMAAGIPILANDLAYVRQQLENADCGSSVPFAERERLVEVIDTYAHDQKLRRDQGSNGRRYFENQFNWDRKVTPLRAVVEGYRSRHHADSIEFRFDWVSTARGVPTSALERIYSPWTNLTRTYVQEVVRSRLAYEAWRAATMNVLPVDADTLQPGVADAFSLATTDTSLGTLRRNLLDEFVLRRRHADMQSKASKILEGDIGSLKQSPSDFSDVIRARDLATQAERLKVSFSENIEILDFLRRSLVTIHQLSDDACAGLAAFVAHLKRIVEVFQEQRVDVDGNQNRSFEPLTDEIRSHIRFAGLLGECVLYRDQVEKLSASIGVQAGQRKSAVHDLVHILRSGFKWRQPPVAIGPRLKRISELRREAEGILHGVRNLETTPEAGSTDENRWRDLDWQSDLRKRHAVFEGASSRLSEILTDIFVARYGDQA